MKIWLKKHSKICLVILLAIFMPFFVVACTNSNTNTPSNSTEQKQYVNIPAEYYVEFSILGNTIYSNGNEISVQKHNQIIQDIERVLIDISKAINTTIKDSTVSKINAAAANTPIALDRYTKELLQISKQAFDKSNGQFSPTLYNLSQIWGFTPEFEGQYTKPRPEPSAEAIANAKANSNFNDLVLDFTNNTVTKKNANLKIDFGGIAKGYMADKVKESIQNALPNTQIDCGVSIMSNIVLMGKNIRQNRGYTIAIDNPRQSVTGYGFALVLNNIQNLAISTSGDTYRFFRANDKIYSHIIDYTTGKPAANGVISATAIVPMDSPFSSTWTDIYSTLAFCMPLTEILKFYQREQIAAVVITNDYNYYRVESTKVGNLSVLNRNQFDKTLSNYFTDNTGNATDNFTMSEKEIAYIANKELVQQNATKKESVWVQIVIFLTIATVVVAGIVAFIVVYKKRKEKNE